MEIAAAASESAPTREHARPALSALTGIRFFAAISVVFCHFSKFALAGCPRFIRNLAMNGGVAVSFFFVLSGFILAYNYVDPRDRAPFRKRTFLLSRLIRIYPAYLVALVCFYLLVSHPPDWPLLATFLMVQSWHPRFAMAWNGPGWSVSDEAFFYASFPLLRPLVRGRSRAWYVKTSVACLGLKIALAGVCALLLPQAVGGIFVDYAKNKPQFWMELFYFSPLLRLTEFLFGICVCELWFTRDQSRDRKMSRVSWLAAIGVCVICGALPGGFPYIAGQLLPALVDPLFGVLIYALACRVGALNSFLSKRWWVVLGDASYAIYIFQVPVRFMIGPVTKNFWVLCVALTAMSVVFVRYIEEPFRAFVRKRLLSPSTAVRAPT